jgi:hypothetical protein
MIPSRGLFALCKGFGGVELVLSCISLVLFLCLTAFHDIKYTVLIYLPPNLGCFLLMNMEAF